MLNFIRNFLIVLGNLFRKPRTVVYPKEKIIIPESSRGVLHLKLDPDSLEIICSACGTCSIICPKNCIVIKKKVNKSNKKTLDDFCLDLSRCIFCGNCVEFCDMDAIDMSYQYQLAERRKKDLMLEKSELIKPSGKIREFW